MTENVLYRAPDHVTATPSLSTDNPLYAVAGAEGRSPKRLNTDPHKPINVKGKDLKPGEPVYEDLDDIKNNAKKINEEYEDLDVEKEKMKVQMKSASGRRMNSYEEWDPKVHGKAKHNAEKPNKNKLSEDNRPRYEDHPISFKRRGKDDRNGNVGAVVHSNPIYDNSPVQPGRGAQKHVYDNVRVDPKSDDISGTSIINPVYGEAMDLAQGTGDCASGIKDPLYESIPEKEKRTVDRKAKRRSYLRSVSSEKAEGYEELEKNDDDDHDDDDDVDNAFGASKA